MLHEIEQLPEVVVLKTGERVALETTEALLAELHKCAQSQPIEFCNLAQLLRHNYHRAARRQLRKLFPQANSDAVSLMLITLRAALIYDGTATRLGSPYDITASYQNTGGLYDQHLYQTARRIADVIYQTALEFGNDPDCPWMADQRSYTPNSKAERSRGLFLEVYGNNFPHTLVTPWGTWQFVDSTERTHSSCLWKGNEKFLVVATSALQMEKVSSRLRQTIFAIDAAFDEELPRATILSDLGQAGESQYRYITSVWQHSAEWLDPGRYF